MPYSTARLTFYVILNQRDIQERMVPSKHLKEGRSWWENEQWDKIDGKLLVDPIKTQNLNLITLDLSVGDQYVSLREPKKIKSIGEKERITVQPLETVLVLTQEYIALPKDVAVIVVPRARWIFGGTSINATRVDPSWYGKLIVGFNNLTKFPIELEYGEAFCSCIFVKTSEVQKHLTRKDAPVGRDHIERLELGHIIPWIPLTPDQVKPEQLNTVIGEFGYPWDIVRGAIRRTKDEITDFVEKEKAPDIVRTATTEAIRHAYRGQQRLLYIFVAGILGAMFTSLFVIFKFLGFI